VYALVVKVAVQVSREMPCNELINQRDVLMQGKTDTLCLHILEVPSISLHSMLLLKYLQRSRWIGKTSLKLLLILCKLPVLLVLCALPDIGQPG